MIGVGIVASTHTRTLASAWVCATLVAGFASTAVAENVLSVGFQAARVHTVGGPQEGIWNLWSNGEIGDYFVLSQDGEYTIQLRAYGSSAAGVWPLVGLVVDDEIVDRQTVDSDKLQTFSFVRRLEKGLHKICVMFMNDAMFHDEDRNLYFDSLGIQSPDSVPAPALGDKDRFERTRYTQLAALEDQTVSSARAEIERVRKGDFTIRVVDEHGSSLPHVQVAVTQLKHDFLFGANLLAFERYKHDRQNRIYKKRFRELFNFATTGFYWRSYEREQGKPQYAYTDKLLAWCDEYGIQVKGHPLLWGTQTGTPLWTGTLPSVEQQETRVREIVSRYAGKIPYWEVVNEPGHEPDITIDAPHRWAREADPSAKLIVNDYEVMANGYPPFFELLERALQNGVPIDGIGIQAHEPRTMRFPLHRVKATLDKYATLGKALYITEFIPTSAGEPITGSHRQGKWDQKAQAEYAEKFYTVCFAHPAVKGITWWDFCDQGAWLKGGGLLDENFNRKLVYRVLHERIHSDWTTKLSGRTDAHGQFSFRGFFGEYAVRVGRHASAQTQVIALNHDGKHHVTVVISD
jgi:endo-1,4-beta-xylanase